MIAIIVTILAVLSIGCKFNRSEESGTILKSKKKLEVISPVLKDLHTPADALEALKSGNERYLNGQFEHIHIKRVTSDSEEISEPFVAVLTCTDYKIPPEILFDQEKKNMMVLHSPANVADKQAVATLDSLVSLKGMKLILVLGHNDCNAIREAVYNDATQPSDDSLKAKLEPAIPFNPMQYTDTLSLVNSIAKKNVKMVMDKIANKVTDSLIKTNKIGVAGAYYDAKSGKLTYENFY